MSSAEMADLFRVERPARPYPGLRPFQKDEWPIFFGREIIAEEVIKRLIDDQLIFIHGDSGCGKSSLVRAAVLPRLERESARGGIRWETCTTRPGESPLWNLAYALADLEAQGDRDERAIELRRILNSGADAPTALAERLQLARNAHVCILIDQFEELFDHARRYGRGEAARLAEILSGMSRRPAGLYVVATMRSEYLGACALFHGLAETVNASQYLLPAMSREGTRRAIREPARLFGGEVDSALADRLIADAAGTVDALPLLQHALMLLHRRKVAGSPSEGWRLCLADYPAKRGIAGLISEHADAVMLEAQKRATLPEDSRVVEDLFRAISDTNADGSPIRRPQIFDNLVDVIGTDVDTLRTVIDVFGADGVSFITAERDMLNPDRERIDVGHEALLRYWRKIADPQDGWLVREFRNGLVWKSLLVQTESFERNRASILGAQTTRERKRWMLRRNASWAERYGGGWTRVQKLLAASDAAQKRATRNTRLLKGVLATTVTVAVVVLALFAYNRRQLAAQNGDLAGQNSDLAASLRAQQELRLKHEEDLRQQIAALQKIVDRAESAGSTSNLAVQVNAVAQAAANLTTASTTSKTTNTPALRVYIQIADNSQRAPAEELQKRLTAEHLKEMPIVAPGVELVKASPKETVLRCFRVVECKTEGTFLLSIINHVLAQPQAQLQDLSGRYGDSPPEEVFELWFAPGGIKLRGPSARPSAE